MPPGLAYFQRLGPGDAPVGTPVSVTYNPEEYTLTKEAHYSEVALVGLDSPLLQFVRGAAETTSLELFFDSTDAAGMGDEAKPVTEQTDQFYELVKLDGETHHPPVLFFGWGDSTSGFPGSHLSSNVASQRRAHGFKCVVEQIAQRFTLFSPKGVPLRAILTVRLKEYRTLPEQLARVNPQSADHTSAHVVAERETLTRVAAQEYGDPARWRLIAERNDIDDPLAVAPGTVLEVPPVP